VSRLSTPNIIVRVSGVTGLVLLSIISAWSASYKVLYNFTGVSAIPSSGLMSDAQGNAYGVTLNGGHDGSGSAYQLSPTSGYHLLYAFNGGGGGKTPEGNLVMDSAGNLYGTTFYGGASMEGCSSHSCGVVFELSPPADGEGLWTETVLHSFCQNAGCADGANPTSGVTIDSAGNLYGTTQRGGSFDNGAVFELSPSAVGWTETVLHSFGITNDDGTLPGGGLIFDGDGNLYGTTQTGGQNQAGIVFELSHVGDSWSETILYAFGDFSGDGSEPLGTLAFDAAGNLYGTTQVGGSFNCSIGGCGTVFQLTPSGGNWLETIIHNFRGSDGAFPLAGVVLDSDGNVYGTTNTGGNEGSCTKLGCGVAFKLTSGSWTASIFRFSGGADGGVPTTPLTLKSDQVYGTASEGGTVGSGVVFQITQ
jgi:uncharacterized repeat protein (TIGR03803 family)